MDGRQNGWSNWNAVVTERRSPALIARIGGLVVAVIGVFWVFVGTDSLLGGTFGPRFLDILNGGPPVGACEGCGMTVEIARGLARVIVVLALLELIAGLGAVFGKDLGRLVSIIYSVVFGVLLLLVRIAIPISAGRTDVGETVAVSVGLVVAYAFAAIVLMAWWRRQQVRPGRT